MLAVGAISHIGKNQNCKRSFLHTSTLSPFALFLIPNSMETVCLKCGHKGFPETLVFCNKCRACALHRYCLDGQVIFTEAVTWFCEDCEGKLVVPPPLDQSKFLPSVSSDTVNLENNAIQVRRELKNCRQSLKKTNKQQKRKIKKKQKKGKEDSGLVANTKNLLPDSCSSPELEHEHPQHGFNCEEESELITECGPAPRDLANIDVVSKSVPVSQGATTVDLSSTDLSSHVDALPIANPIWRGSLYFCNETIGTVGGLLAHLSNLACLKVAKESELFPEVLHAELLSRSMVWPKGFKNGEPTDKSIALYFFPEDQGAEKVFDALVDDIIHLELAIRFVAKNAELLIFPSSVLPAQSRRFQAKYYLWGVFRRKQTSCETNDAVCRESAVVDKALNLA